MLKIQKKSIVLLSLLLALFITAYSKECATLTTSADCTAESTCKWTPSICISAESQCYEKDTTACPDTCANKNICDLIGEKSMCVAPCEWQSDGACYELETKNEKTEDQCETISGTWTPVCKINGNEINGEFTADTCKEVTKVDYKCIFDGYDYTEDVIEEDDCETELRHVESACYLRGRPIGGTFNEKTDCTGLTVTKGETACAVGETVFTIDDTGSETTITADVCDKSNLVFSEAYEGCFIGEMELDSEEDWTAETCSNEKLTKTSYSCKVGNTDVTSLVDSSKCINANLAFSYACKYNGEIVQGAETEEACKNIQKWVSSTSKCIDKSNSVNLCSSVSDACLKKDVNSCTDSCKLREGECSLSCGSAITQDNCEKNEKCKWKNSKCVQFEDNDNGENGEDEDNGENGENAEDEENGDEKVNKKDSTGNFLNGCLALIGFLCMLL